MPAPPFGQVIRHLHNMARRRQESDSPDRELLERFAIQGEQVAFERLVWRHGPMVYRVCRQVLDHDQDAEDAFQAVFLVLAQHAKSIRKREALAQWLHGVAYRTAMKARRASTRRRIHESKVQ